MTAKFPSQKYSTAGAFVADYASAMAKALNSVRPGEVDHHLVVRRLREHHPGARLGR